MHFFRELPADEDPHRLLDPEEQVSTPWGKPQTGPCDKCSGDGPIPYRCLSCIEEGSREDCPACGGRVEWADACPTCAGTGEVVGLQRRGVSVFPSLAGLYRYLVERELDLSRSAIVELAGELSDQPDLDADSGALLIHPTEVITRHAVDEERIADLRSRLAVAGG
ncbi:MAG: hypothetical protein ACJ75R_09715 [Solirubrobacterales bacterium]